MKTAKKYKWWQYNPGNDAEGLMLMLIALLYLLIMGGGLALLVVGILISPMLPLPILVVIGIVAGAIGSATDNPYE